MSIYATNVEMTTAYGVDSLNQALGNEPNPGDNVLRMDASALAAQGWMDSKFKKAGYDAPFDLTDPAFPDTTAALIEEWAVVIAVYRLTAVASGMREKMEDRYLEVTAFICDLPLTLAGVEKSAADRTPTVAAFVPSGSCVDNVDPCLLNANRRASSWECNR